MRKFFFLLAFSFFAIAHAANSVWEADEQIAHVVRSPEFSNTTIQYPYNGILYPVIIVHNPKHENLMGKYSTSPMTIGYIISADLPFELAHYLEKKFVYDWNVDENDAIIELKGRYSKGLFDYYPVHFAEEIDDPINDKAIRSLLNSSSFCNKCFYYNLNGEYYIVRVLYNPEKLLYTASRIFSLEKDKSSKIITIKWPHKYGMITNKPAPHQLIEHLQNLVDCSYWEWYTDFKVHNGTMVEYSYTDYGFYTDTTHYYDIDTWFYFTEDLELKN